MRNTRPAFLIVILLVVLWICFYARNSQKNSERELQGINDPDRDINRNLEAVKAFSQWNRSQPKPEVTESEFAAAVNALSEYDEDFERAMFSTMSGGDLFSKDINQLLYDRRVAKIFSYLQSLSQEEADRLSTDLFDRNFKLYQHQWARWLNAVEDGTLSIGRDLKQLKRTFNLVLIPYKPDRETLPTLHRWSVSQGENYFNAATYRHAATTSLFLCSYFSSPNSVDERIRLWHWFTVQVEKFHAGFNVRWQDHELASALHAHILLTSGVRNGRSLEELYAILDKQKGLDDQSLLDELKPTEFILYRWDANITPYNASQLKASEDWIVAKFPGFNATRPFAPGTSRSDLTEEVFKCLKEWRK